MSAADKWLSNKAFFAHMVQLVITLIGIFVAFSLSANRSDNAKLNEILEGKADIPYVDAKMNEHEKRQAVEMAGIKQEISNYKETQGQILELTKEIRDMTKNRLDRLEDKVYE